MADSQRGVAVDALADALFWYEVVRRGADAKLITVEQACEQAGITAAAFYSHKRRQSDKWRRAMGRIEALVGDEALRKEARLRAMELLRHGSDTAAASLVARLLEPGDKHEAGADEREPVQIVIEQFGEDDHGGGSTEGRKGRRSAGGHAAGRGSA